MGKYNIVKYGKYKDKTFLWVYKNDPEYLKTIKEKYFEKYSSKVKTQFTKIEKKLLELEDLPEKQKDYVSEALTLIYAKKNTKEIIEYFKEKHNLSHARLEKEILPQANHLVTKNYDQEKKLLVDLHVNRYNKLYNEKYKQIESLKEVYEQEMEVYKNGDIDKQPKYPRDKLYRMYIDLSEILTHKEGVLGMHSKHFKIKLGEFYRNQKLVNESYISFENLNFEEKIELLELFDKCRTKEGDIKIIRNQENKKEEVEDVEFEEVIESPISEVEKLNTEEEIKKKASSLDDVQKKIKENLNKKIQEAFDKTKNSKK